MSNTITLEEIVTLRGLCEKYKLDGREILTRYLNSELAQIYNGAGPDSWSNWSRQTLTAIMKLYKPVVLIHDVQFHESDGEIESFKHTVLCWRTNCRKIFDTAYPLWTWRMLRSSYRIERAYWFSVMDAADLGISGSIAFNAWLNAEKRRENK